GGLQPWSIPQLFPPVQNQDCSCRCGEDASDDVLHYIHHCPLVAHLRNRISPSHSLPQIFLDKLMSQELCAIINYVNTHQEDILQLED
ncbi:hypothetical protein AVEN_100240-1, partial [Araneus ventricosus]